MSPKVEFSIRKAHSKLSEGYENVQQEVRQLLEEACSIQKWVFDDRKKSLEAYALKLMSGRYEGYSVDDFYACTIVVPNLREVPKALKLAESSFEIIEKKPGAETKALPTNFNFDSMRLYCRLKQSVKPQGFQQLNFELQIKTLLEHAWSKATHDFSYKGSDVSWAKERFSAQIKAVLDNVDLSIFEMENISSSVFLDKKNPHYETLKSIVDLLKNEFGVENYVKLVEDSKRLAEHINRILKRTDISFDELRDSLKSEYAQGRGSNMRNLSVYSVVLLSLIKQHSDRVKKALKTKASGRNRQNIVIPYEVMEEWNVDSAGFKNVTILEQYEGA